MEYSREETIHLGAEDLRAARARLGITSAQAARRAGVAAARYGALEKDSVPSSQDILRELVSVCLRLDMESVRIAYLQEIGQYANIDLSRDPREPLTAFLDVLEADVAELQDIECFISPAAVFGYLERIGFGATLGSRKLADKQMVELLTGAVFTLFLGEVNDYYVKPVKGDPPDVEILAVERDSRAFSTMKLEIVQDGKGRLLDPGDFFTGVAIGLGRAGGFGPISEYRLGSLELPHGADDGHDPDGSAPLSQCVPETAMRRAPGAKRFGALVSRIDVGEHGELDVQHDRQVDRE